MSTGDGLEVTLVGLRALANGEVNLSFAVHKDDAVKTQHLLGMIGHSFMMGLARINYTTAEEKPEGAAAPNRSPPLNSFALNCIQFCKEPRFRSFLEREFGQKIPNGCHIATEDEAADMVKHLCQVQSRREIAPGTAAGDRWERLMIRYVGWDAENTQG